MSAFGEGLSEAAHGFTLRQLEDQGMRIIKPGHPLLQRTPRHHLFPRQYRKWFRTRGVNIDDYTIELDRGSHEAMHYGEIIFGKGGWWNANIMMRLRDLED